MENRNRFSINTFSYFQTKKDLLMMLTIKTERPCSYQYEPDPQKLDFCSNFLKVGSIMIVSGRSAI